MSISDEGMILAELIAEEKDLDRKIDLFEQYKDVCNKDEQEGLIMGIAVTEIFRELIKTQMDLIKDNGKS